MSELDWKSIVGWDEEKIDNIRLSAFSYIQQGHYKIAQVFFDALVIIDPENLYDLQTLGALYLELNDPIKALRFLDRALSLDPLDESSKINRAKALFLIGYRDEAITLAKDIVKKSEDADIASDAEALVIAYT